jgi:hypothetical protein
VCYSSGCGGEEKPVTIPYIRKRLVFKTDWCGESHLSQSVLWSGDVNSGHLDHKLDRTRRKLEIDYSYLRSERDIQKGSVSCCASKGWFKACSDECELHLFEVSVGDKVVTSFTIRSENGTHLDHKFRRTCTVIRR